MDKSHFGPDHDNMVEFKSLSFAAAGQAAPNITSARNRENAQWSLGAIRELSEALKEAVQRIEHHEECPRGEGIPDHLFTSGVQIGGSGKSLAVVDWEDQHPCTCGLLKLQQLVENIETMIE